MLNSSNLTLNQIGLIIPDACTEFEDWGVLKNNKLCKNIFIEMEN